MSVDEDLVNHPRHYATHASGIECIDIKEWLAPSLGDALKYLWRCDAKGAFEQDIRKARWYVNREIERMVTHGDLALHQPLPGFVRLYIDKWAVHEPPSLLRSTILLLVKGTIPALRDARARLDEIIDTFSEKESADA